MSTLPPTVSKALGEPRYTLQEHFSSFQGEGVHMGRAAYFLRFYGCDQKCSFCDSAGTWHPDYKPAHFARYTAGELAQLASSHLTRGLRLGEGRSFRHFDPFVVLTGGEPAMYDLHPLVQELAALYFAVHIETAGHRPLPPGLTWVTLSPKYFAHPPLDQNWGLADEVKLIVTSPEQLERDARHIEVALETHCADAGAWPHLWLHPEWSQRENPNVLHAITSYVKRDTRWRAGYQMHKLYQADLFDPHSDKRLIPLGGVASGVGSADRRPS